MNKPRLIKLLSVLFAGVMLASMITGCRMNLPDVSGIGPKDSGKEEEAAGDEEVFDLDELGDDYEIELDEADGNTDVTAGTVEEGTYSMVALLNDETYVYVDAVEAVLKNKDASKASKAKDSSGNLNDARLKYLTAYYEGDEASAKEDLAEYEKATLTGDQQKAIKGFAEDLGKIFAQFDITNYDLTAPTDADESSASFDVYSSANEPFSLEFTFEENTITEINFTYDGELE